MKFSEYFEKWLYGSDGYYSNYKTIGKEGDFFTAVSSSMFFGGTLGKRFVDIVNEGFLPPNSTVVEIGAHHGYLMADMIQFIHTLKPELIENLEFVIVERFEELQKRQKEYFKNSFGDAVKLKHVNSIDELECENAFIVANEIFDAFPCELIYTNKEGVREQGVVKEDKIEFIKCEDEYLNTICDNYKVTKGEIGIGYEKFARTLNKNINRFEFITFDYGEKYPRNDFSCRIYSKHNVHPLFEEELNLKEYYGKSDITYDVNFAHIIDSFADVGVTDHIYKTQLKALVEFGIIELLDMLKQNADEQTFIRESGRVKTLLNPTGMGDRFKMTLFRKG
jgi:SAM-dependent MidA family methyltransferase